MPINRSTIYNHDVMLNEIGDIATGAKHIQVDYAQLKRLAEIMLDDMEIGQRRYDRTEVPNLPVADLLQYYMTVGCHNFLFWELNSAGRVEATQMEVNGKLVTGARTSYACHMRALQEGRPLLEPQYLVNLTLDEMKDYYRDERTGSPVHKLIPQRLAKFCEIGAVLIDRFEGSFLSLIDRAEGYLFREDGYGIVQQLSENFQLSYGDWPFCKLIMVTLGNLYKNRRELFSHSSDILELRDPEKLEVGADYYRPFFLYRVGVLQVDTTLREHLTKRTMIPRDSTLEREFRALTIYASQLLAAATGKRPIDLADELWGMGFSRCRHCYIGVSEEDVPCRYRSVCKSYNQDSEMMEASWPLVITTNY